MPSLRPDCREVTISEELGWPLSWVKDRKKEADAFIFKVKSAMGGGKTKLGFYLVVAYELFVPESWTVKTEFYFFVLEEIWSAWSCRCLVVEPWSRCLLWFLQTNLLNMFLNKTSK